MLTFTNPDLIYDDSAEIGPDAVPGRVLVAVRSVQVHCSIGDHRWIARDGDGFTFGELGGLQVQCPYGHGSAAYQPPAV